MSSPAALAAGRHASSVAAQHGHLRGPHAVGQPVGDRAGQLDQMMIGALLGQVALQQVAYHAYPFTSGR